MWSTEDEEDEMFAVYATFFIKKYEQSRKIRRRKKEDNMGKIGYWKSVIVTITCKRGSAKHSVKDDHAFLWEHAIFRSRLAETHQPIKMKFCTIAYIGEIIRFAKNGWNRLAGGGLTDR